MEQVARAGKQQKQVPQALESPRGQKHPRYSCSQNHCRSFTAEPSVAVGMDKIHTFPFSHNTELEKTPASRSELSCAGSLPPFQGTGLPMLLANWFHFPRADPRWHTILPPHTHPGNPWLLHLSTISSARKKESCGQLPESGPSEADRGRRGRRNSFISRAQEPGSPADPVPPHPMTGCRSPL